MNCDLCGRSGDLFSSVVEGVNLRVCKSCGGFGKTSRVAQTSQSVVERVRRTQAPPPTSVEEEFEQMLLPGLGPLIKSARERRGWKQDQLAKRLAMKTSMIHNVESGHFEPSIDMARRFERMLGIRLVREVSSKEFKSPASSGSASGPLTLGDMIKSRRR